jgi:hypothetical protein
MFYDGREYSDWREAMAARPRRLYLIQCGPFVKIGVATEVEPRLLELQIGNPIELKLIWQSGEFTRSEAYRFERLAHRKLAAHRVSGEWFQIDPETARTAIGKAVFA